MGVSMNPCAMNNPVMNSSESPGRKKPINSPHSAKMIRITPIRASGPSQVRMFSGSRNSNRATVSVTVPRYLAARGYLETPPAQD